MPGKIIEKDPRIIIAANSEPLYVRMFVKIDTNFLSILDSTKGFPTVTGFTLGAFPPVKFGWILTNTTVSGGYTIFEYRYNGVVRKESKDIALPFLFDSVAILPTTTTDQLSAITDPTIQLAGQIIQIEGFRDSDEAFTAIGIPSDFKVREEN